ncbi:MAG: hypothetical protein IAG13_04115 [Deltaproteobacteria bacterium]|nr:hypothetical protein [Nannocystaceae bacterium]
MLSALGLLVMLGSPPSGGEREALWTALDDLRRTEALYRAVLAHPGNHKLRPFHRILREKRRHERRLVKLTLKRGYADPPVLWDRRDVEAPGDRTAACARAVDQELRNAAIYETAMALPLAPRVMRAMRAIHRRVRNRHIPSFEACVKLR